MSNRKIFTKAQRNAIWNYYINVLMWKQFKNSELKELNDNGIYDYSQNAPCPFCGKRMLKAQYQGSQPDKKYSWDIDHIDGKSSNNSLSNLQPMHPWCNKQKAGQNI